MSEFHKGNVLNQIAEEEHDHDNYAKRVNVVAGGAGLATIVVQNLASTATIFAVVNAGSGGTSSTDDSPFTVGTDAGTPLMALFESTPDTVNDGDVGVVGMTANRWQKTKMESAATIFAVVNTAAAGQSSIVLDDSVANIGFATVSISNPTLFAVVNTAAAGQSSVVLDSSVANIGFATVNVVNTARSIVGNITLSPSVNSIGFATVNVANTARTITGNVTLSNPNTYIGLTTTTLGRGHQYIGLATVQQVGLVTVVQASAARTITGNLTLSNANGFIGLVSVSGFANPLPVTFSGNVTLDDGSLTGLVGNVTIDSQPAWSDPNTFIGLVTAVPSTTVRSIVGNVTVQQGTSPWVSSIVGNVTVSNTARTITGNVTLSDSKTFIGLTTAWSMNAGTTKTLIPKNFSFAQASVTTIVVPSNTFNITSLIANSNATVGLRVKSGATYLIGNVSLSVMLNPGGGWVQHGSPDSPVYKGLAGAAAIVVEKEDFGQVAEIAGHLMYYDE